MKSPASPAKGIFLRGKTYWVRFSRDGKQHFISLQTADPVLAVERAMKSKGSPIFKAKDGLAGEIERFIRDKKLDREFDSIETERWARRALKHLIEYFPRKTAGQITKADMQGFLAARLKEQREAGAMSYMRAINSFFTWAKGANLAFDNPAKKLVRKPKEGARKKFATKAQRDAIFETFELQRGQTARFEAAKKDGREVEPILGPDPAEAPYNEELHFIAFCAFQAGFRFDEIVESRPEAYHLDMRPPFVEVINTEFFDVKNDRVRTVPITTPFLAFLRTYGLRSPYMLMPDKRKGKHIYRYDFRKPWNNMMTAHNMRWCTPHHARRTFGSILVQSSVDPYRVIKWMGISLAVFEQHYGHLKPGDTGIDKML